MQCTLRLANCTIFLRLRPLFVFMKINNLLSLQPRCHWVCHKCLSTQTETIQQSMQLDKQNSRVIEMNIKPMLCLSTIQYNTSTTAALLPFKQINSIHQPQPRPAVRSAQIFAHYYRVPRPPLPNEIRLPSLITIVKTIDYHFQCFSFIFRKKITTHPNVRQ